MGISKVNLMRLATSSSTFFKGADYKNEGRVEIQQNYFDQDDSHIVLSTVWGSNRNRYHVKVKFTNKDSDVALFYCDCPAFEGYDGACKHIIATILEAEQTTALGAPRRSSAFTDGNAIALIQKYAHKSIAGRGQRLATLEPIVEYSGGELTVSFKIGYDGEKHYVIRDLGRFKTDLLQGNSSEYNKNFTFVHTFDSFSEGSKSLVRYLAAHYSTPQGSFYYTGGSDVRKRIVLVSYGLDDFFNALTTDSFMFKRDYGQVKVTVVHQNPKLSVQIKKQPNGSFSIHLSTTADGEKVEVFTGGERSYILKGDSIYCCDEAFSEACADLIAELSMRKSGLSLHPRDMKAFYATVLARVVPYLPIDTAVDLSVFEQIKLISKLYLDLPQENLVTGRLTFSYGEEKHSAFLPKSPDTSADMRGELLVEGILQKYLPTISDDRQMAYLEDDEDGVYKLISEGLSELGEYAEVYYTDAFKALNVKPISTVTVGVHLDAGLLDISFSMGDFKLEELISVLQSYRSGKRYHRFKDGSFVAVDTGALSEFSELLEGLSLTDKEILKGKCKVPQYRALYLDTLMKQSEGLTFDRDSRFKQIIRDIDEVENSDFQLPETLKGVLRKYQKTGFRWLKTLGVYGFGGILADDMGLGKTIQVIALLLSKKEEDIAAGRQSISLVVCPSSLVLNWKSEIERFAPELVAVPIMGSASEREELLNSVFSADEVGNSSILADVVSTSDEVCKPSILADIIITSYDSLKRDIVLYSDREFLYEIIDEAQYIKNHATQNAKAVKAVHSSLRLALTGTPVENNLAELWSIYDFLMSGYLFNYNKFRQKFEIPIVKEHEDKALHSLQKLAAPFILRRLKRDVLKELPEKTETILYAALEGEQKKLYRATVVSMKKELAEEFSAVNGGGQGQGQFMVLAMLTKLRQICCDPSLIYDDYASTVAESGDYYKGSAKTELCMELIDSCVTSGHKLLLFSQFTSVLAIIEKRLVEMGCEYYKITGQTKSEERMRQVNRFNEDNVPVFLISLKAGGTGLNLTGADVVIHFDPWWNISAQNQATDRAHRIGQKNHVQVYKLIAKDTIEEKILLMQSAKAKLAEMVLQNDDSIVSKLSKDELIRLFD